MNSQEILPLQNSSPKSIDEVTRAAAHLSLIECGLGAIIHGFKIPFGGHLLSLNQGAYLCNSCSKASSRKEAALWACEISGVAAALKSLSPAGQKLGPMIGISMQGMLFAFGQLAFGQRYAGQAISMMLLCLWAFLQSLVSLTIAFGIAEILSAITFYEKQLNALFNHPSLKIWHLLAGLVLLKISLALMIPIVLRKYQKKNSKSSYLENKLIQLAAPIYTKKSEPGFAPSPFLGALKDLTRPLFLFSFLLMLLFWSVRDPNLSRIVWLALRPIAVGFVIFYILRSPNIFSFFRKMGMHSKWIATPFSKIKNAKIYIDQISSDLRSKS